MSSITGHRHAASRVGDKLKTLMITDPDGNHIAFAQAVDKSMAQ